MMIDPTVLFVSGASGSGKSTFIHQFATGRLTDEIMSQLPSVSKWTPLGGNDCLKHRLSPAEVLGKAHEAENLVFHYDSMFIWKCGIARYDLDPIFQIFETIRHCTIVVVATPPKRLLAQLHERESARLRRRGSIDVAWGRFVRKPLMQFGTRLTGTRGKPVNVYKDAQTVEAFGRKWDDFVRLFDGRLPGFRVVYVEPTDNQQFRLTPPPWHRTAIND